MNGSRAPRVSSRPRIGTRASTRRWPRRSAGSPRARSTRRDSAPKHDLTARVSIQAHGDRLVLVGHRIWTPDPGEPLDFGRDCRARSARVFPARELRGDCLRSVSAPRHITRLQKQGLPIRELSQTVGKTTAFSQSLYDAIKGRNLQMYAAADLRTMAMNAVAVETGCGWRLAKEKSSKKIDGVIALAMAVDTAIAVGQGVFIRSRSSATVPRLPRPHRSRLEASQARIAAHTTRLQSPSRHHLPGIHREPRITGSARQTTLAATRPHLRRRSLMPAFTDKHRNDLFTLLDAPVKAVKAQLPK